MNGNTTPDQTNAAEYVETAARDRIGDLAALIHLRDTGNAEEDADARHLEGLGVEFEGSDPLEDQAERRLDEYPLAVEAMIIHEVILGIGGPDSRLIFECDVDLLESSEFGRFGDQSIRRVLFRYSWEGSAEIELYGDDRVTAEDFARRVVPELADA